MRLLFTFLFLLSFVCASAAHYYLDSSVGSSGVGTSWATAFKAISNVPTLNPDDILEISGGTTNSSQSYDFPGSPGYWNFGAGSAGHLITIQIGQDSSHNGLAILNPPTSAVISGPTYFTFSGKYLTGIDGIMHFKISAATGKELVNNVDHCTIEYVDMSAGIKRAASFNTKTDIDFGYCYVYCDDLAGVADCPFTATGLPGTSFDMIKVHHCTIYIPYSGPGIGVDGFQLSGGGYSIYNNHIVGYSAAYTGGQHQDGMQDTGNSQKIKIYNNDIENIASYGIYMEPIFGGFTDLYVFNNYIHLTDNNLNSGHPAGISTGARAANPALRIYVINNLAVDYNTSVTNPGIGMNNAVDPPAGFTSCIFQNNMIVNSGTSFNVNSTGVTNSNNLILTAAQAATRFTSYTAFSASNNMKPLATATDIAGQGADNSAVFTTDFNGATRVVPWDIGPYIVTSTPGTGGTGFVGRSGLTGNASIK